MQQIKQVYFNEFATTKWGGVQEEFDTNFPEPANVLYADYEYQNYEGEANVIWQEDDGSISYVSGGHCSCYGLEGQWEVETYPEETIRKMIQRARESDNKWSKYVLGIDYEKLERLLNGTD